MSFRMLSEHHLSSHEIIPSTLYPSNQTDETVLKYLESLRARLEFARFKMNQGWEGSTLPDVEQLWRERQERQLKDLPKPRFTQRDIIDRRSYIPSLGMKHSKIKKSKSISSPQLDIHATDIPMDQSSDKHQAIYFHHYKVQGLQNRMDSQETIHNDNDTISSPIYHNTLSDPDSPHSEVSRNSPEDQKMEMDEYHLPAVRNSLDYLSYAIAMTEADHKYSYPYSSSVDDVTEIHSSLFDTMAKSDIKDNHSDIDLLESDIGDSQQTTSSFDSVISPPSSPVTTAAKAIMMFGSRQGYKPLFP